MTRILKPVPGKAAKYLNQVCGQYFRDACGLRVIEYNLGNNFTGMIDLLATDDSRIYLVTIGTADFPHSLFRSLMGYRWFKENIEFLRRAYSREEVDMTLPLSIIILSQEFPPGTSEMCEEICTAPISLYRYRLFGSDEDPDISMENISCPREEPASPEQDLQALRTDLGIEQAGLTDQEIIDFRSAMGFY